MRQNGRYTIAVCADGCYFKWKRLCFLFAKHVPEQIKGQLSVCIVCSEAWALLTEEGKAEKGLGYHAKKGRRDDWRVSFCLGRCLWELCRDSQAGVVPRLICLNGWGAALLPPHGLHPWGMVGEGEALMKSKVPSSLPWLNKVNLSPSSRQVTATWHVLSRYPLARVVTHHFNNRRLWRCWPSEVLAISNPWALWAAGSHGPWDRVQGCVLACPIQSGPLPKIIANNPCGLPDRHVVELSLWNM